MCYITDPTNLIHELLTIDGEEAWFSVINETLIEIMKFNVDLPRFAPHSKGPRYDQLHFCKNYLATF